MSRNFSKEQREVIFELSGGSCAMCKAEITIENFHADHVHPHAMGGETKIGNAQALCADCNLKKGPKVLTMKTSQPAPVALRNWQQKCLSDFKTVLANNSPDYFVDVVTGAGKTLMGLSIGEYMLKVNPDRVLLVLVPSCPVRDGWKDDGSDIGLTLQPVIDTALVPVLKGRGGFVVTYDALRQPNTLNEILVIAATTELVIIYDEVHHTSEGNEWGKAATTIGAQAAVRVGMSGTLFRTDDQEKIPYLSYDATDTSIPHFTYTYKEGLTDGVIAPLTFRPFDGSLETTDPTTGVVQILSFNSQTLTDDEISRLMRAATDPAHNFFRTLLAEADQSLQALRKLDATHKDGYLSSGLVVARDIDAAKAAEAYLRNVLKYRADQVMVVTSDDDQARDKIKQFRDDKGRKLAWLVSCGMVSEGVSIDHLRVLAYLTNKRTQMLARQVWGRLVRLISSDRKGYVRPVQDQMGYVFMPALASLVTLAEEIDAITRHVIGATATNQPIPGLTPTRVCPNCATHNATAAKTCTTCGTPLAQPTTNAAGHIVMTCDASANGLRVVSKHGEIIQITQDMVADIIKVRCNTAQKQAELIAQTETVWVSSVLNRMVEHCDDYGQDIEDLLKKTSDRAKELRDAEAAQ